MKINVGKQQHEIGMGFWVVVMHSGVKNCWAMYGHAVIWFLWEFDGMGHGIEWVEKVVSDDCCEEFEWDKLEL